MKSDQGEDVKKAALESFKIMIFYGPITVAARSNM
jgi:hypothetical protein